MLIRAGRAEAWLEGASQREFGLDAAMRKTSQPRLPSIAAGHETALVSLWPAYQPKAARSERVDDLSFLASSATRCMCSKRPGWPTA